MPPRTAPTEAESFDPEVLLAVLSDVTAGDFTARMPVHWTGMGGKVADRLNHIIGANQALGDELDEVRILDVRDGVFFAQLVFVSGAEVEARPSDSIALALRAGARIVCAEDVLDEAGIASSDDEEEVVEQFREFLDEVEPEDFG